MTVEQCWQPVPGGSGRYVVELLTALADVLDVRVVGLAARHGGTQAPHPAPPGRVVQGVLPRRALYAAWDRVRLPRAEWEVPGTDVVHATTWAVPGTTRPLVVTVHDVAFLRDPGHFTPHGVRFFRRALDVVRGEAARVVVPSEATRLDVLEAGVEDARVVVVPHGVRAEQVAPADVARWRARAGVERPYVLWCGTVEPRKNVARLVRAFTAARAAGLSHDLVLAGPAGWGTEQEAVAAAVAQAPAGSVHVVGRLTDEELQAAYAGADLFAFCSTWEGFGMPVLEAMAHGVPVVTSRGTSMAEVVGDAGTLVDPLDVDAIAGALMTSLGADREAARKRSLAVAGRFSWETAARAHAAVYRAAAG